MDIGETLRRARERKGLSLEEISRSTKISLSQLRAIENDLDRLTPSLYTRGFLRAYAREVELDPEEIVDTYRDQVEPSVVMGQSTLLASNAPRATIPAASRQTGFDRVDRRHPIANMVIGALFVVALVAYLAFTGTQQTSSGAANAESTPPAPSDAAPAAATPAVDNAAVTPAVEVVPAAGAVIHFEISATGPCWVSIAADGQAAASRLMQGGERQAIEARDELVLRVGDPAACEVSIDGIKARPVGEAGQPVTVRINRENYRQFLSS